MRQQHRYTPEQEAYLKENWATRSLTQMAAHIGVREGPLQRKVMRMRQEDNTIPRRNESVKDVAQARKADIQRKVFTEQRFNPKQLQNMRVYKKRSIDDKTKGKERVIIRELKNLEVWYDPSITTAQAVIAKHMAHHRYELTGK
jgi:hypothetical protein